MTGTVTDTTIHITAVEAHQREVVLRQPFRFGMLTLRSCPQLFLRVRLERGGETAWGVAAEMVLPKWFDKRPEASNEEDVAQLFGRVRTAARLYRAHGAAASPYALHAGCADGVLAEGAAAGRPPLVANYGPALLDRAVIDAVGRLHGLPVGEVVRRNLVGLDARRNPDLADADLAGFLSQRRIAERIAARHTVGLVDAISDADIADGDRLQDGLPQSLEACARRYGHRWFKLKVGGDLPADLDRLRRIAAVLDALDQPYRCSLDGNEQYPSAEAFRELWEAIGADPALATLRSSIAFVEQPIARAAVPDQPLGALGEEVPVIIDESDGTDDAFPAARELGYRGVSSKQCKGFYRALLNAARCTRWNAEAGGDRYLISGEDLVIQAGVALQQDLSLASLVGCSHLERNGHHYVDGLAAVPEAEQAAFLAAHPRLYHREDGVVRLRIEDGAIDLRDLESHAGLGSGVEPDWGAMETVPLD